MPGPFVGGFPPSPLSLAVTAGTPRVGEEVAAINDLGAAVDLAVDEITALEAAIDTDATLAANSDLLIPTQKAVKGYVDSEIAAIPPPGGSLTVLSAIIDTSASRNVFNAGSNNGVWLLPGDEIGNADLQLNGGFIGGIDLATGTYLVHAVMRCPSPGVGITSADLNSNVLVGTVHGDMTSTIDTGYRRIKTAELGLPYEMNMFIVVTVDATISFSLAPVGTGNMTLSYFNVGIVKLT